MIIGKIASGLLPILLIVSLLHLGLGLGFHFRRKRALEACREARIRRGEYVEPEVFSASLVLAFDAVFWPVYGGANVYHDGTPFATPCAH